jgi:hypothetical protein
MPRKRILIGATAAVVAVLAITAVVVVGGRRHAPVTASSLGASVGRKAGRSSAGPCTGARIDDHVTPGVWDCDVWEEYGSYGTTYRVRVEDGESCWTATRGKQPNVEPGVRSELPARISGCVERRD